MTSPDYRMLFDLTGKSAIVTGGVGILGRHFCAGLADFGAEVAVVDLEESAAIELANEIASNYGVPAIGVGCDVSSEASVTAMVDRVVAAFGKIDVLHNNAATKSSDATAFFAPFEEYDFKLWREVMAVNLDGMFLVAKCVGRQMVQQQSGGSVIQTASVYGVVAPDQRIYEGSEYMGLAINTPAVYSASKAGVIGLTRYLATYWAGKGIRVNSITPGGAESGQNEAFKSKYAARVPMGRMAQPHEMVGALVYLASDASRYVTGQNLVVDGGLSAW